MFQQSSLHIIRLTDVVLIELLGIENVNVKHERALKQKRDTEPASLSFRAS